MTNALPRLAIIGIGLIGSSIARAALRARSVEGITVIDQNPDHLSTAVNLRLGDRFSKDLSQANDADFVILVSLVTIETRPCQQQRGGIRGVWSNLYIPTCTRDDVGGASTRLPAPTKLPEQRPCRR